MPKQPIEKNSRIKALSKLTHADVYPFQLERTLKALKAATQKRFNELGVSITVEQWSVLQQIGRTQFISQVELAALSEKDRPTITRILDLLAQKGWIERKHSATDRRAFIVGLTPQGRTLVNKLQPDVSKVRHAAWKGLTERDFTNLQKVLDTIRQNLNGTEQ